MRLHSVFTVRGVLAEPRGGDLVARRAHCQYRVLHLVHVLCLGLYSGASLYGYLCALNDKCAAFGAPGHDNQGHTL